MKKVDLFEDLMEGLQEAVQFHRGTAGARVTSLMIEPIPDYSKTEIKSLRQYAGMTQTVFAEFMGVSVKTVEAWEGGRSCPSGPSRRLMQLLGEGVKVPVITGEK